jgi:cytochrome oxidase Cu insertion factor (SCO1/SenC/PrrC family)
MTDPRSFDRREALLALAAGAVSLPALGWEAAAPVPATPPAADSCGLAANLLPDVVLMDHEGRKGRFRSDLLRERTVLIHFTSVAREASTPIAAPLAEAQRLLGPRLGRDLLLLTITSEPEVDGTHALAALAARYGAGPGWKFLTGEPGAVETVKARLFASAVGAGLHSHGDDCSLGLARYGRAGVGARTGLWGSVPMVTAPAWIAERLLWVAGAGPGAQPAAASPPRRRGPLPLASRTLTAVLLAALLSLVPRAGHAQHPHPQPIPPPGTQTTLPDGTIAVSTSPSLFPQSYPFQDPPGTNLLPTVYTNLFDSAGNEIPNTLPSTPTVPYNLHDGSPQVSTINPTSPTDDLQRLFSTLPARCRKADGESPEADAIRRALQMGIDILEGNPIPDRVYSGLPLLHYVGPLKKKKVEPILDAGGKVAGGNVDVHQIWYDGHIESDTYLLDAGAAYDVPWTVTYTVDVLNRGEDDFSPFALYFDLPKKGEAVGSVPLAGMDQTFFPIRDGTRTVFKVKMPPSKYWNLIYTWGWRMHPPRIQVIENANKQVGPMTTTGWEISVFGANPRADEAAKLNAIAKIGDLAPEKRMWKALRQARDAAERGEWERAAALIEEGQPAFFDWKDRNQLPRGVAIDKSADLTLFYVNNTIYGQFTAGTTTLFPPFQTRGATFKVTLLNGDNFPHAYEMVDFGGARGWENQFKSSVKVGGSGCFFTFGRVYWLENLNPYATIPPATSEGQPGVQKVQVTFNYDPSRRLRFYQFDPTHHDEAIYSIH